MAAKQSIFVTNAPGVIDTDYRGEVCVLLYNGGFESHYVQHGDRVGQLLLMPITILTPIEVNDLSDTKRGTQGFGSTGR